MKPSESISKSAPRIIDNLDEPICTPCVFKRVPLQGHPAGKNEKKQATYGGEAADDNWNKATTENAVCETDDAGRIADNAQNEAVKRAIVTESFLYACVRKS